jgi:hypothetical protein
MKTAYFVMGPESSGTRMLTEAFIKAGCYGDSSIDQRMDDMNFSEDLIVFRRSLPHGGIWPNIPYIISKMAGYTIRPIMILRDKAYTIKSQIKNQHVATEIEAIDNIRFGIEYAYRNLAAEGLSLTVVLYETFVKYPEVRGLFFKSFGLVSPSMEFHDGNLQYV